jgi:hypothetical protein
MIQQSLKFFSFKKDPLIVGFDMYITHAIYIIIFTFIIYYLYLQLLLNSELFESKIQT